MWIVFVDGGLGLDAPGCAFSFQFPRCLSVPLGTSVVVVGVFEVAVLNQFCIETSVGCITDVLEEDAHEVWRDILCVVQIHFQLRVDAFGCLRDGYNDEL